MRCDEACAAGDEHISRLIRHGAWREVVVLLCTSFVGTCDILHYYQSIWKPSLTHYLLASLFICFVRYYSCLLLLFISHVWNPGNEPFAYKIYIRKRESDSCPNIDYDGLKRLSIIGHKQRKLFIKNVFSWHAWWCIIRIAYIQRYEKHILACQPSKLSKQSNNK